MVWAGEGTVFTWTWRRRAFRHQSRTQIEVAFGQLGNKSQETGEW
jgi:hypothetical protein